MITPQSPVHAPPRITREVFHRALKEGPRKFTGTTADMDAGWNAAINAGVDPSFMLGHFWVESLFCTDGWCIWANLNSWGNSLIESTTLAPPEVTKYAASNGYNYCKYPSWTLGAKDYVGILARYRDTEDPRYGDSGTIDGATARWAGKPLISEAHKTYVSIVIDRMTRYDAYNEEGDDMALHYTGLEYKSNLLYQIKAGDRWYPVVDGDTSWALTVDSLAQFHGTVNNKPGWFAIRVITSRLTGKSEPHIVYMKGFSPTRVSKA